MKTFSSKYVVGKIGLFSYVFVLIVELVLKLSVYIYRPQRNLGNKLLIVPTISSLGDTGMIFHYVYLLSIEQGKPYHAIVVNKSPEIDFAKVFCPDGNYEVYDQFLYKTIMFFFKSRAAGIIDYILYDLIRGRYDAVSVYKSYDQSSDEIVANIQDSLLKNAYIERNSKDPFYHGHKDYYRLILSEVYDKVDVSRYENQFDCVRKELGITKKYVLMHARYNGGIVEGRTVADINNYIPSIEFLISNGYQVVRIGRMDSVHNFEFVDDNFIDYATSEHQSIINDILLTKECEFFIGCSSGPIVYVPFFKVPVLMVNSVGLITIFSQHELRYLHKKVFQEDNELGIDQIIESQALYVDSVSDYQRYGYVFKDNDEVQILDAVKEVENIVSSNKDWQDLTKQQEEFVKNTRPEHMGLHQSMGAPVDSCLY